MSAAYARARAAGRYPEDWDEISIDVREDADWVCQCRGECGRHRDDCLAQDGEPHPVTGSRVVLTVAHLDHNPANCDEHNLRAMCQRCHLAYDHELHLQSAYASRRQGKALGDLFDGQCAEDVA